MIVERRNPCATCGACCRSYLVPLCGHDIWRIAEGQRLAPQQFVVAVTANAPDPDTFRLEPGGERYTLVLEKRGEFVVDAPCVFLLELGGGHSRCGIYGDRPLACQCYPMSLSRGAIVQRDDSLCPPGSWLEEDLAQSHWRSAHRSLRRHWDVYMEVVGRWNARVDAMTAGTSATISEYVTYLLNVYASVARIDARYADAELAQVVTDWRTAPTNGEHTPGSKVPHSDAPPLWLRYFHEVRSAIDRFFPEIVPLPIVVVAGESGGGEMRRPTG